MRKTSIIAVSVIAAVSLGTVATASADNSTISGTVQQKFDVTLKPIPKGASKAKPKAIALGVTTGTLDTTNPAAAPPTLPTTKNVTLFFPKIANFNGSKFPTCSAAMIEAAQSIDVCKTGKAKGSILATGKAQGIAAGIPVENLKITVANGVTKNGKTEFNMFVQNIDGALTINTNIPAKISKASGKYGFKLEVPLPENLQQPVSGLFVAIPNFEVIVPAKTIKKNGKKINFIEATSCPKSGVDFGGKFEFINSTVPSVNVKDKISGSKC